MIKTKMTEEKFQANGLRDLRSITAEVQVR